MKYISTPDAPSAVGPYSQGVVAGNFVYTAGQIALTPDGELANQTIEDETKQVMANLTAILAASECRLSDVVHVRIYISSSELFPRVNKIYAQYFTDGAQPARECVVASPPLEGAHVEISMIAHVSR
jgi:2-iminobutanoate/2-iminopropanoate deaminase